MSSVDCRRFMIPLRTAGAAVALAMIAAGTLFGAAVAVASQGIEMPDGLKYTDNKVGDGATATPGAKVSVHYTGWLYKDGAKMRKADGIVSFHLNGSMADVDRLYDLLVLLIEQADVLHPVKPPVNEQTPNVQSDGVN